MFVTYLIGNAVDLHLIGVIMTSS